MDAALCGRLVVPPPLPQCKASPSLLLPACLASSSSPAIRLPMGCCGCGSEEQRVGKSLVLLPFIYFYFSCPSLLVFKMPTNIIGSWDALRCLIWNVSCYLSF